MAPTGTETLDPIMNSGLRKGSVCHFLPSPNTTKADTMQKQIARAGTTLASDFDKLKVKQFELEFTVDPLFKKTSADFDEGGANGILMNHLGCDSGMKVVFDAGDAKLDDEDDEEEGAENDEEIGKVVDIGRLKGSFSSLVTQIPPRRS
jgi:hypothetical protein